MNRRDRHFRLALAAMLALNVVTALAAVLGVFSFRRRFNRFVDESTRRFESCERASVDAAAVALAVSDCRSAVDPEDPDAAPVVPRVVFYGQTKSRNARWIYRDVEVGGVVHREYIKRLPLSYP